MGFSAYYGLALLANSWTVAGLALFCHGLAVLLKFAVEKYVATELAPSPLEENQPTHLSGHT